MKSKQNVLVRRVTLLPEKETRCLVSFTLWGNMVSEVCGEMQYLKYVKGQQRKLVDFLLA